MIEHPGRIVVSALTKRFDAVRAVENLSFTVEPGSVTGFLGPNGAGKTTTLRMLLGLITPDAGAATIGGRHYRDLLRPNDVVGAALEASGFHPARSGHNHLRVYCRANGYPVSRADESLDMVGLTSAAHRAVGGYSLGMRQRLALAAALLGDPHVLVLDEPANGLDPDGIVWMRELLRDMARQGRTVLVSSHVLTEVQQLVDHVVIINNGQLVRQGPLSELFAARARVWVRTPQTDQLARALEEAARQAPTPDAARIERTGADTLEVTGMDTTEVGRIAFAERIELHELATRSSDLEAVFFSLTASTPALQEVS